MCSTCTRSKSYLNPLINVITILSTISLFYDYKPYQHVIQIAEHTQLSLINISEYQHIQVPNSVAVDTKTQSCMTGRQMNTICDVPNNISFQVLGRIGHGVFAAVTSVLILNDNKKYAMKVNFGHRSLRQGVQTEYEFLYQLQAFANWRNISLNTPWLHPNIPPLYYIKRDTEGNILQYQHFHFVEQITNCVPLEEMEIQNELNGAENTMDILSFYINGYHDIMFILEQTAYLNVYHNDIHKGNILIDRDDNYRWYLIDFGLLFYDTTNNWYNKTSANFFCRPQYCPPSTR